jgi:hypothetical protein
MFSVFFLLILDGHSYSRVNAKTLDDNIRLVNSTPADGFYFSI